MKTKALLLGLGTLTTLACGGGNAASSSSDLGVATGETLTEFQKSRLLGHYSTEDGASGFILDRTGTPWKAKLDGGGKVCALVENHGPLDTKEYRCPDHSIWVRVGAGGDVELFQGPKQIEGVRVIRDADAKQL